ncbi:MAG: NADP-dependent oxidoreductase [Chthoniobacteraceae bacterium]
MKAICLEQSPPSPVLVGRDLPVPQPGAGELLIRVHAAGVTPTELVWYPTTHTKAGTPRLHAVPGHEFSGEIAAVGEGVTTFTVGQAVYGMNDWFADGATAEYCLTVPAQVAPKPANLSHPEAASVPIGALTAWQGLFSKAKLKAGERVLIHGGAGAVGVYAIQLARQAGAQVITTASARNAEFLHELGAQKVIDYHTERFEDAAGPVEVIFDGVGGETLQRSWGLLGASGRLVTIAADSEGTPDERTKAAFFIVEPHQQQLQEIAAMLDAGTLKTLVDAVLPLAEAPAAYLSQAPRSHGRGKVVIDCTR